MRCPRSRTRGRRGSALVPVVAALLTLSLCGIALVELQAAQTRQTVLGLESAQAFWTAEAGVWHAALQGVEFATPLSFAGGQYTVSRSGSVYNGVGSHGAGQRSVMRTIQAGSGGNGGGGSAPIALWEFSETSGTTASDSVGTNDGTLVGGSLSAWGPPGGGSAIRFDGSDDRVVVPHDDAFLLDAGTLSFWFNCDYWTGYQGLVTKDSLDLDDGGHLLTYLYNRDVYVRLQSTSTSYYVSVPSLVRDDTWYHFAFTFGPGGMRLYVDGVLRDTDGYTGGLGSTSGGSGNREPFVFGASTDASGDQSPDPTSFHFDGQLDTVAVYDVELSAAEVLAIYQAGGAP